MMLEHIGTMSAARACAKQEYGGHPAPARCLSRQTLAPLYSGRRGGCSVTKRNFPVGQKHALQGMVSFPVRTKVWRKRDARHHVQYTFSEAECHTREANQKLLAESAWKMLRSLSAERPKRGRKRTECENFMRKSFHSCRKI